MASLFPLEPPPGFRGLDPNSPVETYQRHLPHWRQAGATYFVTFRLADSLPRNRVLELKQATVRKREELARQQPSQKTDADTEERLAHFIFAKVEEWLDQGMGSCVLGDKEARSVLEESLGFSNGERYELGSYVVMPNHAHIIVRPSEGFQLATILQSWKRRSSREINKTLQTCRTLWQNESFDRIVRDPEHLWRCLQYIGHNPHKAGLEKGEYTLWLNPAWQSLGWDFNQQTTLP